MQRVLDSKLKLMARVGITSAHAESTLRLPLKPKLTRDHLCACREYTTWALSTWICAGSPLRMQRVLGGNRLGAAAFRITSAHAESTPHSAVKYALGEDHLCACREYLHQITVTRHQTGSPLRMQRVLDSLKHRRDPGRITSAHAESTRQNYHR